MRAVEVEQSSAPASPESFRTVESPPHFAGPDRQAVRPAVEAVRMLPVVDVVPGGAAVRGAGAGGAAAGVGVSGQRAAPASSSAEDAPSPGREKIARDRGRGSRSYVLEEKDDTAIHLEVFERSPDMPEMHLDSPWPRRAAGYSKPPAGILKRLNRIHCVPCPGR